jgi:GntR family transcriptional regulator/MocR family aminotransferase
VIGLALRSTFVLEIQTNLHAESGPLHVRLTSALRGAIRSGRLVDGAKLPPSRVLAADLGCSRWVVTQAYEQLVAEGYLRARPGSATRVRWPAAVAGPPARVPDTPVPPRYDLAPGLPDLRTFPRRRWAEAIRTALADAPDAELGYPVPGGHPLLRAVLADYLTRARGAIAAAEDVSVCAGVTDGVGRLCRGLRAAGHTAIAVEDPGWGRLRVVAAAAGLATVPVPVDGSGMDVTGLPDVRAVIVTPAHHFPTGTVLAPGRRAALVDWARRVDGLIVEDDYDAEFRYDRRPVATVQGMAPDRVALFGSLSKTLSPALGIGWAVAPPRWSDALRAEPGPSTVDQLALAHLVRSGGYERHLRAARHRYRARRDALVDAVRTRLPPASISGVAAGLHLLLDLPGGQPAAVVDRAAQAGLAIADLAWYRVRPGSPGLVLGYGNLADSAVPAAVELLAAAVTAAPT